MLHAHRQLARHIAQLRERRFLLRHLLQHTSASVRICQHTSAYRHIAQLDERRLFLRHLLAHGSVALPNEGFIKATLRLYAGSIKLLYVQLYDLRAHSSIALLT